MFNKQKPSKLRNVCKLQEYPRPAQRNVLQPAGLFGSCGVLSLSHGVSAHNNLTVQNMSDACHASMFHAA